ncbi:hypothetical protein R1flu_010509 [Riccia fluitans]|uniref:Ribosomal protein L27 n=1 Tax=Riccia fluitans TaxID=41844 RepID=A0ABD1Z880_9MARC
MRRSWNIQDRRCGQELRRWTSSEGWNWRTSRALGAENKSQAGSPALVEISIRDHQMALGILTGLLRGGRAVPRSGYTALTTKRGPKGFYKGKGCKSTGRHTSKGRYILMAEKLPQFVVPDLTGFKLKPYVAHNTPKVPKMEKASEEVTSPVA